MSLDQKVYEGALAIVYKKQEGSENKFLLVKNKETDNISFVAGGKEESDTDTTETLIREIQEELGLNVSRHKITSTGLKHEFVFNKKKKGREGGKGEYDVFLIDASDIENITPIGVEQIMWETAERVENLLSFEDLKEVFNRAIKLIE